jgi:hypothetical protein
MRVAVMLAIALAGCASPPPRTAVEYVPIETSPAAFEDHPAPPRDKPTKFVLTDQSSLVTSSLYLDGPGPSTPVMIIRSRGRRRR